MLAADQMIEAMASDAKAVVVFLHISATSSRTRI